LRVYALPYRDTKAALRRLTDVAASQGGYFTARQAERGGYGASHLSYHVRAGNFERAGHGLYRIPTLPLSDHDDLVRLWLWSRGRDDRPQAVISHQTALALHDLAELIPTTIHLTVPPGFRKRRPRGCLLHKGIVEPAATQPFDVITVTTPLKTLGDLAIDCTMPTGQFRNAVSTALKRGLITRREAEQLLAHRRDGMASSGSKGRL
jgi:predicted transcriptional regulator of viral defense system